MAKRKRKEKPQAQAQTTDNSLEESANPAAEEVSEEKEIAEAATKIVGQVLEAAAKAEAEAAEAKAEQAEKAAAAREEAEATAARKAAAEEEKNGEKLARQVGLAMRAAGAGAGAGGAAETEAEQRQKETAKAEQARKVAARETATTAPKKQAARERQTTREEIAVGHITQIYKIARGRELFQCLQFLRSNRWPEEKENQGNMAKEADEKLIEMILHARANPNSRTAKVFREQYQFDVNTGIELEEKSSADQESDGKNKKPQLTQTEQHVQRTLIKAYKEAVRLETNLVTEFLAARKKAIDEEGYLITSSKFKNADPKKIQLTDIIDHTRESRLIRWLLSWLPIPGCFYSGARSYGLFKTGFEIDTRDSTNAQKPSAKIAAEMLVKTRAA